MPDKFIFPFKKYIEFHSVLNALERYNKFSLNFLN